MNKKPLMIEICLEKSQHQIRTNSGVVFPQGDQKEHEEYQYLQLLNEILNCGAKRLDRNNAGIQSLFGKQMRFNLADQFPLFTTKKIFWRGVVEEMLWMVTGSTNARELIKRNVHIWDANCSRQFLDSKGFMEREEGDLGPVSGFQWRHYGAQYRGMNDDYTKEGIDQLSNVIQTIRERPNDRRMIINFWNPVDIPEMSFPPNPCLLQFWVANGRLSCMLYQRSADMGQGVPFNVASFALLTRMVAHVTNMIPGDFICCLGDCHIYTHQVSELKEQLKLEPRAFPILRIRRRITNIEDFRPEDFELINYNPHMKNNFPLMME